MRRSRLVALAAAGAAGEGGGGGLLARALSRVREGGTAHGTNLVAYSGGVDSSLVAALLARAYPANSYACIGTFFFFKY